MSRPKRTLSFDLDSLDNIEEVTQQSQSLHTLKMIGLVQIVYVFFGYSTQIFTSLQLHTSLSTSLLQTPGGISLLSAIAALIIFIDCNPNTRRVQLLIYIIFVLLDVVGWLLRMITIIHSMVISHTAQETEIITLSPYGFVLILSILGLAEARSLQGLLANTRYVPLSVNPDSEEVKGRNRTFTELCYYPLRRICALQLTYCVLVGFCRVIGAIVFHAMGMLEFLINPSLGILTPFAVVCVLAYILPPQKLNRMYGIMIGVDMVFGMARVALGFMFNEKLYTGDDDDRNVYFLDAAMWTLFIFFLWGVGIYESQKIRKDLSERSSITDHVDHIFSL